MDHKNKDHAERTEDVLFCIIVAGIIIFVGGLGILHVLDLEWIAQGAPCFIYSLTGWYCPGCGGTRAVKALLCGRLFDSICYHPAVPYLAAWTIIFLCWQSLHYLSKGRIRGFKYRSWHLWATVLLFFLNFIIKNAAQLMGETIGCAVFLNFRLYPHCLLASELCLVLLLRQTQKEAVNLPYYLKDPASA